MKGPFMHFKLEIGMYVGGSVSFTGKTVAERDLGGSEYAAVKLSEAFAARGHLVTVYTKFSEEMYPSGQYSAMHNGVAYSAAPHTWLPTMRHKNWDVFIVSRDYGMLRNSAITTKQLVLWNHDVLSDPEQFSECAYGLDRIYCLSEWHKQQFLTKINTHGADKIVIKPEAITVTRNGVDVPEIAKALTYVGAQKFDAPTFLYASRPERGLFYLLRDIWPALLARIPMAELLVCSYDIGQEGLPDAIKDLHMQCDTLLQTTKNAKYLGHLPRHELYKVMAASWAMLYPSVFPEISCLTVMESQACGTPALTSNYAALAETNRTHAHQIFDKTKILRGDQTHAEKCARFIERFVADYSKFAQKTSRVTTSEQILQAFAWQRIAEEWEQDAYRHFQRRSAAKSKRIIQNFIYQSDLLTARWALDTALSATDSHGSHGIPENYERLSIEVETYLDHHHEEPDQYGDIVDTGAAEDITQIPERMTMALALIEARFGKENPFTFLDVGCGPGRMLFHIMRNFPNAHVMGMDFSQTCLARADTNLRKLLPSLNLPADLCVWCGDRRDRHVPHNQCTDFAPKILPFLLQADFINAAPPVLCMTCDRPEARHTAGEKDACGAFQSSLPDVVWAGEWLEHQVELERALHHVNSWCKPGGLVIYSVPNGPWEALSFGSAHTKTGFEIRSHVSHFEERDLREMFRDAEDYQCVYAYIQRSSIGNEPLGQFVVSYTARADTLFPPPDYHRKFVTARPRPTIGAALIAKNEEHNILRALQPLARRVDLIYVGDTGSTDMTVELAEKYATVFHIGWDENTGFAGARNKVRALMENVADSMDYILWLDCDEVLLNGHLLRQYTLGDSEIFEAFILEQRHLMLDMPMTADRPMRLFRNNKNYQFHGVIHEQLMDLVADPDGNTPVFPALILSDVCFAHYGYLTEGERRQKAIARNLPLLKKDREINPKRELGKIFEMRDYSQNVRWFLERNPEGPLQPLHITMLQAVITIYQDFKETSHQNHSLAHIFYQDSLRILGEHKIQINGQLPIQISTTLAGTFGKLQAETLQLNPHTEWFLTAEDVQVYLDAQKERLVARLLKPFDIFEL
jgi:glycosyltransferase involved in cell wall biosynthesis/2-polyprenyl-3-methyl-5-hydroxy-6-metoxy-1,4-benzoquinol methylase